VGGECHYNWFNSIEGRDRHQETYTSPTGFFHPGLTTDFNLTDSRTITRAFASWQMPFIPMTLRFEYENWRRHGSASGVSTSIADQRFTGLIGGVF
jgi:hypothetical protein